MGFFWLATSVVVSMEQARTLLVMTDMPMEPLAYVPAVIGAACSTRCRMRPESSCANISADFLGVVNVNCCWPQLPAPLPVATAMVAV
jgi:hypothetical protein